MATTTTNFGWDIPQSTDLVKDGATAIAALGQDIDTALVDLKGGTTGQVLSKASGTDLDFTWASGSAGAIQNTIVDAKGDLISATAADTPARLAVGANNTVLTADSSTATGLKWATPTSSASSFSLLTSTNLTGASTITISGLSGYNSLFVTIDGGSSANNLSFFRFQFNSTSSNHFAFGNKILVQSSYSTTMYDQVNVQNGANVEFARMSTSAGSVVNGSVQIFGANTTSIKPFVFQGGGAHGGGTDQQISQGGGYFDATAVISSFSLISNSGNFDAGVLSVYGSVI